MKRRRSILALGLGAAADALLGCSSDAPEPAPANSSSPLPPVEAPANLRGVCAVPGPARLFELAKRWDLPVVGSSWAAFAVSTLGLPITASEAFDLAGPLRAALVEPSGPASLAAVVALPLRAPDRLIAVASLGANAPFRAEKDDALHGERLVQLSGEARFEIGVVRNHLVIGAPGVLGYAGAFMADPGQPLFAAAGDEPSGWVAGSVLGRLVEAAFERLEHARRSLLQGALAAGELKGAIDAFPEIPFDMAIGETAASLHLALAKTSSLEAALASLTSGELAPLLAADRDASIAVALHQAEADRVKGAQWIGNALPALGLASEPPAAVSDALVALARARGDGFRLAVERGPAGVLAYGGCDLTDDDAARKALAALAKAAVQPQKNEALSVRIVDTRLTLIGEAVHVFVDREDAPKDPPSEPSKKRLASVLLRVENGQLALATGSDSVLALKKALRRRADEGPASLADLAVVKAVASTVPPRAALYAFFDPARWLADDRPSGDPERDRSATLLALEIGAERVALTLALEPGAARALARGAQGTL